MNNEPNTESVCKPNSEPPSKPDAETVWKQLEDVIVPQLRLSLSDRAVYYHLLRHSRLEGNVRYCFSIASLGRGTRLSGPPVRLAVRRLVKHGALRVVRRSKTGHVVEVRVPEEIRGVRFAAAPLSDTGRVPDAASLEELDFMHSKALRLAIHARERGRCFYCLRRLAPTVKCLDHVVPQVQAGGNSYRNLVSACLECNSQKGEKLAENFLRWLYREHRLSADELSGRVRALDALAAGELKPEVKR
jgi:5-methylcytosine-specific restriction endonuclease McrA